MVSFPVGDEEDGFVERMHAVAQNGLYVLDNSPFYAFGISFGDVFSAMQKDGDLAFSDVISRGGHSTYRIKLPVGREHAYFLEHWGELEQLGCTFEGSSANAERLYAIDVPPGVDVFKVYQVLEAKEQQGIWSFEEGHYFDLQAGSP
jgi:hypothetical protein